MLTPLCEVIVITKVDLQQKLCRYAPFDQDLGLRMSRVRIWQTDYAFYKTSLTTYITEERTGTRFCSKSRFRVGNYAGCCRVLNTAKMFSLIKDLQRYRQDTPLDFVALTQLS